MRVRVGEHVKVLGTTANNSTSNQIWYAELMGVLTYQYFGAHTEYRAASEVAILRYFVNVKSTIRHKERLKKLRCFEGVYEMSANCWEAVSVEAIAGLAHLDVVSKDYGWWVPNKHVNV